MYCFVYLIFPLGTDCPSWTAIQSYVSIPTSEASDSAQGVHDLVPIRVRLFCILACSGSSGEYLSFLDALINILVRTVPLVSAGIRRSPMSPTSMRNVGLFSTRLTSTRSELHRNSSNRAVWCGT